jgi:CRP-like cAMP-binding protein
VAAGARRYTVRVSAPEIPRDELQAAFNARGELGRDLEPEVIEAFLDRIERTIDARVDARVEARLQAGATKPRAAAPPARVGAIVLGIATTALGIGATGTATALNGVFAFLVAMAAWAAIAIINLGYAFGR